MEHVIITITNTRSGSFKIPLIKAIRTLTNQGLKDAKDMVDSFGEERSNYTIAVTYHQLGRLVASIHAAGYNHDLTYTIDKIIRAEEQPIDLLHIKD